VKLNAREANDVAKEKVRNLFEHNRTGFIVLNVGSLDMNVVLKILSKERCRIDVDTLSRDGKRCSKAHEAINIETLYRAVGTGVWSVILMKTELDRWPVRILGVGSFKCSLPVVSGGKCLPSKFMVESKGRFVLVVVLV